MAQFTTFKTGGPADCFVRVRNREEFLEAIEYSRKIKKPFLVIGGGSNVLIGDKGFRGLVIKNEMSQISLIGATGTYKKRALSSKQKIYLKVDSGVFMNRLVRYALDNNYRGLENFLGQPGTVGGAIYINAHNMKKKDFFGDHIAEAEIVKKDGKLTTCNRDYFKFNYDKSSIQGTEDIIISAVVELEKETARGMKDVWRSANEAVNTRQQTQPYGFSSAGCVFRNIEKKDALRIGTPNGTTSVGYLIDSCKLKNKKFGEAMISPKHANFIINLGKSSSADVVSLINFIKKEIWRKYNIRLKEEIIKLGEF